MNSLRTVLATTVAALGIVCTASAHGVDSSEPRTSVVKYGDINLDTEQGTKSLYARLRAASRNVCSPLESKELKQRMLWHSCYEQALTKAVTDLNVERLTALHQRARNERHS